MGTPSSQSNIPRPMFILHSRQGQSQRATTNKVPIANGTNRWQEFIGPSCCLAIKQRPMGCRRLDAHHNAVRNVTGAQALMDLRPVLGEPCPKTRRRISRAATSKGSCQPQGRLGGARGRQMSEFESRGELVRARKGDALEGGRTSFDSRARVPERCRRLPSFRPR